jgi:hypothetical protein
LDKEWIVIIALAVSISFVFSSIINRSAHSLYSRWSSKVKRFEHPDRLVEDSFEHPGKVDVLVVGMGRVGSGAYDALHKSVCGIDVDKIHIEKQREAGRKVIFGDAEDPDFWSHINLSSIRLIIFSMPSYIDTLEAMSLLKKMGYQGKTASIAQYDDQKEALLDAGIDEVFNYFAEVGAGLAQQSSHLIEHK